MKKLILAVLAVAFATPVFAGDVYVNGHWKDTDKDGIKDTYVEPYHRTSPDNDTSNNYSTRGNYNPYTGKSGTEDPYKDSWGSKKYSGNSSSSWGENKSW